MCHDASMPVLSWCTLCLCSGFPCGVLHNAGSFRGGPWATLDFEARRFVKAEPKLSETPEMVNFTPQSRSESSTDADLVGRCVRGDREAFHELTVRYYRPVCGF